MEKQLTLSVKARFDAKIPKVQKDLFEYAASLGGFRTLTDFIKSAVKPIHRLGGWDVRHKGFNLVIICIYG